MSRLKDILTNPAGLKGVLPARNNNAAATLYKQRNFDYVAAAANGTRHKGRMQAASASAVSAALQEDGWLPLSISEARGAGVNTDLTEMFGASEKAVKLSVSEAATLFRQTAELLRAGVAMTFVLQALGEETTPKMRKICDGLSEGLNAGLPLSEAMLVFPDAFDDVTRAYIASGEASGTLPETMARLASTMEKKAALRLKIKGVTAYPKMVSFTILGIVFAILKFMVPMYQDIYAGFNAKLPAPTQFLVNLSANLLPVGLTVSVPYPFFLADGIEFSILGVIGRVFALVAFIVVTESMRNRSGKDPKLRRTIVKWGFISTVTMFAGNYRLIGKSAFIWIVIIAVFMGVRFFFKSGDTNPKNARLGDKIRFRMPIMGGIIRLTALFQWTTTLSGALRAGVPLTRAVILAGDTSGSRWYRAISPAISTAIMAGRPLSETLSDHADLFGPTTRAMVSTGEVTGDLPTMFDNVSHSVESEIDSLVSGLAAKVEVLLLVVMGVVVGGLLIALYLPIINLATAASGGSGG